MQQTNPMRMERRRLADLIPAAYNPRKALTPEDPEYQDIKASIQGLGYADPIVINYDGTIIKGHQRRTVMMDMGIEEAEVVVLDIRDKAKEKMINVALNKITGKWDLQILKDLLSDLDLNGYDFSVTGFHQDDLEDLIQQLDVPEEAHDDDFDPDAAKEEIETPVTRRGDIWKLGRHRLMCGDATSLDDAEILMAGNKLDLVITDPPYNVDYEGSNGKKIQNDSMDESQFRQFLLQAYCCAIDACRTVCPSRVISWAWVRLDRSRTPSTTQATTAMRMTQNAGFLYDSTERIRCLGFSSPKARGTAWGKLGLWPKCRSAAA